MRWLITLAIVALVVGACAPSDPGPGLDLPRVMAHVDHLTSIGPRPQDSDGSRAAAGYIEDELDRLGLDVKRAAVGTVDLPEIRVLGSVHREARSVTTTDPNLVVRFGQEGDALLVMAHYDTVRGSPGAIDNAVAVALLLDLARVLRDEPLAQPVLLAFTANEEIGLAGAEALAAQRDDVAFAVSLDLVGGDGALTLNGASELIGRAELAWLANAAGRAGVTVSAPLAHRVISRWWPQAERSDHGPFTRRGIRAVHFYHRGNDGEWIDLAYHSPRDVAARISRDSVDEMGRFLRALVAAPVPAHAGDGFWLPFAANTVVPRLALIVFELALIVVVIGALVLSREGLVAWLSHARRDNADRPRGPGLLAGIGCYAAAVGVAIAIERALAGAHPAPWLHDPLHALVAQLSIIVGVFGLATRAVARIRPWTGTHRYLVLAAIVPAIIGALLLAIGAAELAWIWLVPAAALALAPRLGRAKLVAIVLAVLPIACVLHPYQLREAAYNGFLPVSLPLSVWVGTLATSLVAATSWWLCRRPRAGPLGTLVLGVGCGLAVIFGLVFAVAVDVSCTPAKFESFNLTCERV